ncbi:MAG: trypsin-like peptidase domain-containing protein [Saprospiraceae bacterium]|jgi:hypothetical protein|nr:trypsin-like peptidase domain-containing protein [Saprospiraceae bacterium]
MRKVPEELLACPIWVTFENGSSGTGVFFDIGEIMFLVTAKHVLFKDEKLRGESCRLICQTRVSEDDDVKIFRTEFNELNVFHAKNQDIACIEIGRHVDGKLHCTKGTKVEHENKLNTTGMYLHHCNLIDEAYVGNEVYVFGYPTSIGLKRLPQFDYNKPLVRKGIISGIYKSKETLIIDSAVYYGNSGGPVIMADPVEGGDIHYKIIGIVTEFIPYEEKWINPVNNLTNLYHYNSGYAVVIPVDSILSLLSSKGYEIK